MTHHPRPSPCDELMSLWCTLATHNNWLDELNASITIQEFVTFLGQNTPNPHKNENIMPEDKLTSISFWFSDTFF